MTFILAHLAYWLTLTLPRKILGQVNHNLGKNLKKNSQLVTVFRDDGKKRIGGSANVATGLGRENKIK